jgi:hypothetical protein
MDRPHPKDGQSHRLKRRSLGGVPNWAS